MQFLKRDSVHFGATGQVAQSVGRRALGSVSLRAVGIALLAIAPATAAAARQQAADQADPAQPQSAAAAKAAADKKAVQSYGPSVGPPSTSNPQATKTPGGSTELPTQDVGGGPIARKDASAPPDNEAPAIVVTGFRASLTSAIRTKRSADQILESVSAEDIGKLPDNSIAESIARLPGVTAQRVDGRDQVISIRGFSPDFSTTLLNGREQVTTNDNRAVEFDQYPSELLGQVVVYKTPTAGLIGQGISGTIDLRTIRPLEYGKRVVSLSARGEGVTKGALNADSTDTGYRVSGTYIDQFFDNKLGVTVGFARSDSPSQFERYNAWGYPTFDGNNATYGTLQADGTYKVRPEFADAQGKFLLGGAKPFVQSNDLVRTGVVGTVEWRPTEHLTSTLDFFYSHFNEAQQLRGIELPLYWGNAILEPGYTTTGNSITGGTWDDVKGVVRNDYVERNAKILSTGWNTKYQSDGWTLVGDISYSRVTRVDTYIETYSGTSRGVNNGPYDTLGFQTQSDGITKFSPTINYADPNLIKLTSPQGWADGPRDGAVPGGQDGFFSQPHVKDELYALRGSISRDLGHGNSIELGANYTSRDKSYVPTSLFLAAAANVADPNHNTSVVVPSKYYLGTTSLAYLGIPGQVSYDPQGLINDQVLTKLTAANEPTEYNTWTLSEDVTTGWLRYDYDTPTSLGRVTGNAGLQVVYTDQSSDSYSNLSGTPMVNNGGITYVDFLPSVNTSLRFDEQNVLRLGASRTLARARMDQLKASFQVGTNPAMVASTNPYNAYFTAGGGNSRLKPWVADGGDVSFEHYFARDAYFAVAGFYKYLESYIYDSSVLFDFVNSPTYGAAPATTMGVLTQPVNGTGGNIYGTEVSATLPLHIFTSMLDGFGVLGSYSYTASTITANPGVPSQPLPGLSKHVANGTVFYEKGGLSVRGSMRYRSGFLAEVISLGPGATNRAARAETIVDAQIGYEFQRGWMKGVSLLVQAQNLTSEPFVTQDGGSGLIIDSQDYGRRFLAGASYKF